ncbi:hypothetical protein ACNKHX_26690 [Shigella flexneri]
MMRRAFSWRFIMHINAMFSGNPFIEQPLMRHVLSRMALQLEGQMASPIFVLRERGTGRADAKSLVRVYLHLRKFVIAKEHAVCGRAMMLGGIGYCEESETPGFTGRCR